MRSFVTGLAASLILAPALAKDLTVERLFEAPDLAGPALRLARFSPDGRYLSYLRGRDDAPTVYDLWAYDIAAAYQIPLLALIDQNQLEPPYALSAGRELRLPPPRFHTVARGERFEDVARRYNVDTRSLALLNRMQAPYSVRQGDRIVLPAIARRDEQSAPPPMPAAAPSNQHASGGSSGCETATLAAPAPRR